MKQIMRTIKATLQNKLGWIVVVGASVFLLAGMAAHVVERDHDLVQSSLSSYAVSPFGAIMEIGFFSLALAYGALALVFLRSSLARLMLARVGSMGLAIEALAVLIVTLFPANGLGNVGDLNIHGTAATIAFVLFPPAALLLALAFGHDILLRSVAPTALAIGIGNTLALALFGLAVAGQLPWIWLAEKVDTLITAVWLIVIGNAARHLVWGKEQLPPTT